MFAFSSSVSWEGAWCLLLPLDPVDVEVLGTSVLPAVAASDGAVLFSVVVIVESEDCAVD